MAKVIIRYHEKVCKGCPQTFSHKIASGCARLFCSTKCRQRYDRARRPPRSEWPNCNSDGCDRLARAPKAKKCSRCCEAERARNADDCTIQGCENPATRSYGTLCEMHYGRKRRTGRFDIKTPLFRHVETRGYVRIYGKSHPMADKTGYAFEHRVVLYDAVKGKCPRCFWCAKSLSWKTLVVDHLNEVKDDNDLSNLMPSCNKCNRIRGAMVPFVRRMRESSIPVFVRSLGHMRAV